MYVHPVIVNSIRRMIIRVRSFSALRCDQKLFSHFSEAGTAIFTIEQFQYGGHAHPPSFNLIFHREFSK
ncbi:hypothetical protein XH88_22515 [Bradyrhizobium sp. CCBAU 51627]|nr:hypothetical protein [Bradyrhizobium sp. CCBAU 51627]